MSRLHFVVTCFVAMLLYSFNLSAQALAEPPTLSAQELRKFSAELQRGGYVVYFRHLDTRHDQEDQQPVDLGDCRKQRNLSDEGGSRGKVIGLALRKWRIAVDEVIASPFCRTLDTARLVGGKAKVDPDLFFAIGLTNPEKEKKGAALRAMLNRTPGKGQNTIIVGHTANLQEAVGLWPKPEGVAYIFQASGSGGLRAVARVEPDTWGQASR